MAADGEKPNEYICRFRNQEATDGESNGVLINAGSAIDDYPLYIQDHDAANNLFFVDGTGQVFAPNLGTTSTTTGFNAAYINTTTGELVRYTP